MALPISNGSDDEKKEVLGRESSSNPKSVGYSDTSSVGLPLPPSSTTSQSADIPKAEDPYPVHEYSYDNEDGDELVDTSIQGERAQLAPETTPADITPEPTVPHVAQAQPKTPVVSPSSDMNEPPLNEDPKKSFIKKKKLLPFGDKGNNRVEPSRAASKFDARVDRAKKARVIQVGVVTSLIGIVAFGGYNAVFPKTGVSSDQVNNAIRASQIANSFPTERAESFGEHFIETYLTVSAAGEDPEHSALLSYFYTGSLKESSGVTSTLSSSQVNQEILMKPKVFRSFVDQGNPDVINLTIGALVRTEASGLSGQTSAPQSGTGIANAKWVYFNVNVFYDRKVDAMAVTKDSPSLLPPVYFGNSVDLPNEKPLGEEENKELHSEVSDSLEGFLKAFAESSPNNTSALTNYLVDDPSAVSEYNMVLLSGFSGEWGLSGPFDTAVQYLVYDDPSNSKGVLIDATVIWEDVSVSGKSGAGSKLTVKGRYFIKMQLDGSKRWVVSWFGPRTFRAETDK